MFRTIPNMRYLIFVFFAIIFSQGCKEVVDVKDESNGPLKVLFSTDIATGLTDTHGGQGSVPVTLDSSGADVDFTPQDLDDGLTVAMALNLQDQNLINVDAVIPTFGNATLPAEMLTAFHIIRDLKGFDDLPIAPGANAQVSQTLQPTPKYYTGESIPIAGTNGSFCAACRNSGVELMYERLSNSSERMTILAIGPLTDVACLLSNYPQIKPKINEIIILASQLEGQGLHINGRTVNDFNFRMDPVAGALFLYAADDMPIRMISFALSGQTSQSGPRHMQFDNTTLKGPNPPTPASQKSLNWILESSKPRNQFWKGIFGAEEGPFDQYTLMAALYPELFDCQEGLAYVQMCPYPAWSPQFKKQPSDTIPYNAANNPCVDHAPGESSLSQVPAQLVVSLNLSDTGPLVRGTTGIDGNIPQLNASARQVTVCTNFVDDGAFETFKEFIYANTW